MSSVFIMYAKPESEYTQNKPDIHTSYFTLPTSYFTP